MPIKVCIHGGGNLVKLLKYNYVDVCDECAKDIYKNLLNFEKYTMESLDKTE